MKTNTYELKMTGLKNAASETKNLAPYCGNYVQISYNRSTGEVLADYICGENHWIERANPDIVEICLADTKMTQQDIADAIYRTLDRLDA